MRTLTAGEIREMLADTENIPDDMPVHFSYDYGDHCHTPAAPGATSCEVQDIKYNGYLSMPSLLTDRDEENDDLEEEEIPEDGEDTREKQNERATAFRSGKTKRRVLVIS